MEQFREVMTVSQASDYIGVSPDTLYAYAQARTIPAFKLGNRWRFRRKSLDAWMDDKEKQEQVQPRKKAQHVSPDS